jgi:hypothetical protein
LKAKKVETKINKKKPDFEKRPHAKDLFMSLEKVLEKRFGEKVFYSIKNKIQIGMENMGWNENLRVNGYILSWL